jgi:rare lipoprotein A
MSLRNTVLLLSLVLVLGSACTTHRRLAERGKRGFKQQGLASWYGPGFHGKRTANGEVYDMYGLTAAHRELPFETVVEVFNHDNGRTVRVRINDRGPFVRGRIIDLSRTAAERIGLVESGVAKVTVTIVSTGTHGSAGARRASAWLIQAGAFQDLERANNRLRTVRAVDNRARLDDNGDLLRVVIGPLSHEKEARRVLAKLEQNRIEAILRRAP